MEKETRDYIDKSYDSLNRRFDSMMNSLRSHTTMIEGKIGLLNGEIADFRHSADSRLGFLEEDTKRIRESIKSNHEELIELLKNK